MKTSTMDSRLTSCDTFVVLSNQTKDGLTIFGKNSDRPNGEVQEIVFYPRKTYDKDSKIECTYISIDSTPESYSVVLSKPSWMWGSEMGSNEFGLCIGNEAVWTRLNGPKDMEERLLGMDLVRLGLERGRTAREALHVITGLLEKYGQGGQCSDSMHGFTYHNSFLIVDHSEAWVLETAHNEWAAERVESGFRNISNCLSIGTKIDLMSENLKEVALQKGFWDGVQEFNFAHIYGTGSDDTERFIGGRNLLHKYSKDNAFDINAMIAVLRDESSGICRGCDDAFPSTSSQVSVLSSKPSRPDCHWFTGTPDPKHSIFKPFLFCANFEMTPHIVSPLIPNDPAKAKPRFQKKVDRRHSLYRAHQNFYPKFTQTDSNGKALRDTLKKLETSCIQEMELLLNNFDGRDESLQIQDLFNDCVESEMRFYK